MFSYETHMDMTAFLFKYAEENSLRSVDKEIAILKKASTILRSRTLKFMKDNSLKLRDFRVTFEENQQQFPLELTLFMEGALFDQQRLLSENSNEKEVLIGSVASSAVYKMKN